MSAIGAAAAQVQEAVAAGTEQAIAAATAEQERAQAIEQAQGTAEIAAGAAFDAQARYDELAGRLASRESEDTTWRERSATELASLRSELQATQTAFQEAMASLSSLNPPNPPIQAATVEVQAATPPAGESPPPGDATPASGGPPLSGREATGGFSRRILRRQGRA